MGRREGGGEEREGREGGERDNRSKREGRGRGESDIEVEGRKRNIYMYNIERGIEDHIINLPLLPLIISLLA